MLVYLRLNWNWGWGFLFPGWILQICSSACSELVWCPVSSHRCHKVTATSKQNLLQTPTDVSLRHFGCCDKIILVFFSLHCRITPEYLQTHRSMFLQRSSNHRQPLCSSHTWTVVVELTITAVGPILLCTRFYTAGSPVYHLTFISFPQFNFTLCLLAYTNRSTRSCSTEDPNKTSWNASVNV